MRKCDDGQRYYTGGINSSFMKSYFAWPSCVYLIKNQIKIWSYIMICLLIRWSQDGHAKKDSSKVWFNAAVYHYADQ